jgi:hypothetical protein
MVLTLNGQPARRVRHQCRTWLVDRRYRNAPCLNAVTDPAGCTSRYQAFRAARRPVGPSKMGSAAVQSCLTLSRRDASQVHHDQVTREPWRAIRVVNGHHLPRHTVDLAHAEKLLQIEVVPIEPEHANRATDSNDILVN